ncbi:MAG: hypothetical protein MMC33_004018 [Icmadophila ericetorum]|nr:hypothetical protein [Icmadophila ericetorum]
MAGIHDTSSAEYHIKVLPAFLKRVEEAFPNAGRSRYATVNVLLLFWEDDDLGVIDEVKVLERVFRNTFRYATERWPIPSQDADDALLEKRKLPASTVKWYAHGAMLENLKSDVLILLDCYTAGGTGGHATNGVKEIIAACGFETWTPGVGSHSFTSALIEELKRLSTGPAFTVAALHSRILEQLRHWSVVYNAEKYGYVDEQGRAQDRERNKTPVYIALNKDTIFRNLRFLETSRGKESTNYVQTLMKEDNQHISWVSNLGMPSGRDSVNIRCIQRDVPQGMYKVCWHFIYIINQEDWDPPLPAIKYCFAGKAVNEREFFARTTDFTQPWISTDFDKIIYPCNRAQESFLIPNVDHDKPIPETPLTSGTYVRLMSSNAITVSDSGGRNIAILIRKLGPGAGGGLLFFMGCELLQL